MQLVTIFVLFHPFNAVLVIFIFELFLPAGLCEAQPCQYCIYSVVQKMFFAPQGRHITLIKVKFGTGSRPPLPHAKFHVYRGRNVGIQPPKLSKFCILAIILPLRGDSFAQFLRNFQRLYMSLGRF